MNAIEDQLRRALTAIRTLKQENAELRADRRAAIAVVGIGCRLPGGVEGPDDFWRLLATGSDAIVEVPADRWPADAWYDPDPDAPGKMNSRWGGFLSGIDRFDPAFFDLSAREAQAMDPQQRLLLEAAWRALEDSALAPDRLNGSRTGVFVGINASEYFDMAMAQPAAIDAHAISGGVASVAAGRLSYLLGFNGPAVAVDTACSSSLTAVHLAVQALRAGDCTMALAGGVYAVLRPNLTVGLSKLRMMAADGRCKSFDERADGFVQGEGCGLVVLKRLDDALRDHDPIRAVIRGSATNQDGRSGSLTAPSRSAQVQVVRQALADAGLAPGEVGYVEAHGTGTALGDPIEAYALADVFAAGRDRPLAIGAVKSNIGHLGPAAGIAGLIKAALVVERGEVPPNLHFRRLNPAIDFGALEAVLPTDGPRPWPGRRVAGVSSFGFAGTNAHVVLDQPPAREAVAGQPGRYILAVSARTPAALDQALALHADGLAGDLAALSRTSLLGRRAFEYRAAVVAASTTEAAALLRARIGSAVARVPARPRLGVAGADGAAQLAAWGVQVDRETAGCTLVAGPQDFADPLALLARLYEAGISVDWTTVVPPGPRAALPGYPFQRKSYWRTIAAEPPAAVAPPGRRIDAPVAETLYHLPLDLAVFPWLADHQVGGRVLVPGAFQIACLAGAWRDRHGAVACRIAGLTFAQPLLLPADLWTTLGAEGDVRLASRADGAWTTHATARIEAADAAHRPAPDLAALRAACARPMAPDEWRERLSRIGITIGPAFRGIVALWQGEAEALARLALPEAARDAAAGRPHPALLDACLQVAGGTLTDELQGEALLPIGIDEVTILAEVDPAAEVWAHARRTATGSVISTDVTVMRADGRPLVIVRGLHVRRAGPALASGSVDGWFHQAVPRPAAAAPAVGPHLVVAATLATGAAAAAALPGPSTVWVPPASSETLSDVAGRIGPIGGIIDVQAWDADPDGDPLAVTAPAFALLQQVLNLRAPGRYAVVGRGNAPSHAALAGLVATLGLEHPDLDPRWLAVDALSQVAAAPELRLTRSATPPAGRAAFSGTVVVTGGLGGLGRRVAAWAADRGAEALVLAGRHVDARDGLAAGLPCPVRLVAADLGDPAAAARLLAPPPGLPPVRGVIHLAGVQSPGMLADLDDGRFAATLAAKARGAWALHRAARDLDHFILVSSVAGVLGAAGQGGYAPANAYLDALARHRRAQGLAGLSVALGHVGGPGMAADLDDRASARIAALGLRPMPVELVLEALDRAVAAGLVDPLIAAIDWRRYADRHPSGRVPALITELIAARPADTDQAAASQDWLRNQAAAILGAASPEDIEPERSLIQLGLDSLMAIELRNRITARFGTAPSIALLLGEATLAELAATLEGDDEWEELTL